MKETITVVKRFFVKNQTTSAEIMETLPEVFSKRAVLNEKKVSIIPTPAIIE